MRASSRQNALNQDLNGWAGSRRWIGGAWRGGIGRREDRNEEREEGLNELGEAPPPYKGRPSTDTAQPGLTVPLRALDREGRAVVKPPDYHETLREVPEDDGGSGQPSHANVTTNNEITETPREHSR